MTEHRNTPRDIVFDMEDDISTLRRHANILLCISTDGSRWTDARDVKVLDSVMEDLTRLGAAKGGQS